MQCNAQRGESGHAGLSVVLIDSFPPHLKWEDEERDLHSFLISSSNKQREQNFISSLFPLPLYRSFSGIKYFPFASFYVMSFFPPSFLNDTVEILNSLD